MSQRKYKVRLSARADRMMLMHTEFLIRVSAPAARRLLAQFKKAERRLADNPHMFPFADEVDVPGIMPKTYRKCLFGGRYKALFTVESGEVFIDAIIDCRQENRGVL